MNNYINYYYNLYPEQIHQQNKFFYFHLNNEKYYFIIYDRPIDEISALYALNIEMLRRGSPVHEIILNKDRQPLTFINDMPYILLRVYVDENKKIDLNDIYLMNLNNENIIYNKILERTNWVDLWSYKIDYFEYQISQVGKKHPLLCECLSYYIGLGENAISYIKNTTLELQPTIYETLTVCHKRIKNYYTLFDLYNPLSLIIDYKIRDLAEYIKESFFAGKDIWEEIVLYFKDNTLSVYSLRLLYGRLLFPSYFFDIYEEIVDGYIKDEEIVHIISKVNEYEQFLDAFYKYISANNNIPPISWLNKKNIID